MGEGRERRGKLTFEPNIYFLQCSLSAGVGDKISDVLPFKAEHWATTT